MKGIIQYEGEILYSYMYTVKGIFMDNKIKVNKKASLQKINFLFFYYFLFCMKALAVFKSFQKKPI